MEVQGELRGKRGDRGGVLLALGLSGWGAEWAVQLLLPGSGEISEKELQGSWLCQDSRALRQSLESAQLQFLRVRGGVLVTEVQSNLPAILVLQGGPRMTEIITGPSMARWGLESQINSLEENKEIQYFLLNSLNHK